VGVTGGLMLVSRSKKEIKNLPGGQDVFVSRAHFLIIIKVDGGGGHCHSDVGGTNHGARAHIAVTWRLRLSVQFRMGPRGDSK
jgi:hypothetical protein